MGTQRTATAELGVTDAAVVQGDDGVSLLVKSGTGNLTYSTTRSVRGVKSYRVNGPDASTQVVHGLDLAAASASAAARGYVWLDEVPGVAGRLLEIRSASGVMGGVNILATGICHIVNALGATVSTLVAFPTGQWVRVELRVVKGTTTSDGTIEGAFYLGDSTTPVATSGVLTTVNAGTADATTVRVGKLTSAATLFSHSYDHLTVEEARTSLLGPAPIAVGPARVNAAASIPAPTVGMGNPLDVVSETYGGTTPLVIHGARAETWAGRPLLTVEAGTPPPPVPVPEGTIPIEVLTGHRAGEGYRVEWLDRDGGSKGDLDRVLGGSIDTNVNAQISGGGRLSIVRNPDQDVDWGSDRLRVWWQIGAHEWPLGTFLPSAPTASYAMDGDDLVATWEVELLDTLTVPAEEGVATAYSLAAGAVVTDAVAALIEAAGEVSAVTPSAETLLSAQTWPAGTTRLRIANDLLSTINYFSLRANGYGRLMAQPYRAPASRPTAWTFIPGETAVHIADMDREQDLYGVPNRIILITQGDPDTEALVATATNDDPDDPLSTVGRGRVITVTEENVEASSQQVLQEIAERRLLDVGHTIAKIQISHAVLPLGINEVVVLSVDGVERRGIVQTQSTPLQVGALTTTVVREVQD